MIDLIMLVGIPLLALSVILVVSIKRNHALAKENTASARIKRIVMRPRAIRDINHQLTSINELMVVENSEEFNKAVAQFIKANVRWGMRRNGECV